MMIQPAISWVLQQLPETPSTVAEAAAIADLKARVARSRLFQMVVVASNHYVFLQGSRPTTSCPFDVLYYDALPTQLPGCRAASEKLARMLGLLASDGVLPESEPGCQRDGWSCGLWCLQEQEHQIRKVWRNEPISSKVPIAKVLHRLNEWIEKVSPAAKALLQAKPKASKQASPLTYEDAVQAALTCSKCNVNKTLGTKGCSLCMGMFFQPMRQRKGTDTNVTSFLVGHGYTNSENMVRVPFRNCVTEKAFSSPKTAFVGGGHFGGGSMGY